MATAAVSFEYFQTTSGHTHANVSEALDVACTVGVVDDWKRAPRSEAKERIIQVSQEMS